jgi:hypothetical protein
MKQQKFVLLIILAGAAWIAAAGQGMVVSPGGNVTVEQGTYVTIINGYNLLLLDDNNTSPSFLERGNLTFANNGKAWVQQYVPKNGMHLVSPPVSGAKINTYMDFYLYRWDEPLFQWINLYYPVTLPLDPGEGYALYSTPSCPDAPYIKGQTNRLDVAVSLDYTPANYNPPTMYPGWNLIGNPFPCPLEWNGDPDWQLNGVDNTIYVWNTVVGQYYTWNWLTSLGIGLTDGFIAATQAFFVKANVTGASLTLPASQRAHHDAVDFYKSGKDHPNTLRLTAQGQGLSCESLISFVDDATGGFDSRYDAYYLKAEQCQLDLFTCLQDVEYAMNILPSWIDYPSVPLSFTSQAEGMFSLTVAGIESFPADVPIWLEDRKQVFMQDLRENPLYGFSYAGGDEADRFVVHFKDPVGIGEHAMPTISIYSHERTIYLDAPENCTGMVHVYDLLGHHVLSSDFRPGHNSIAIQGSEAGYIVKAVSGECASTKMVYLK